MVLCVLIGGALTTVSSGIDAFAVSAAELGTAFLSGISGAVFVICWMLSVRCGAYMMVEVCLLLGSLVPIFFSVVLYQEALSAFQLLGILLLVVAVYIISTYNTSLKNKLSVGAVLLLFLCGLANGTADLSQKLFVKNFPDSSVPVFQFYSFVVSSLVLLILYGCLVYKKKRTAPDEVSILKAGRLRSVIGYIIVMAVCLFLHSYFKTLAAAHLDSVKLYPLTQGGAIIASLFMSHIFFKERITPRCVLGVCIAFGAMLLINFA